MFYVRFISYIFVAIPQIVAKEKVNAIENWNELFLTCMLRISADLYFIY